MSDFDKEAERERLREQYERDKQERKAAEQMSELLLQGATMTNTHCSTCGDPIFRYDGQEFCATCERPVDRDPADQDETDETAVSVADPDEDTRVVFGEESGDDQRAQARSTGRDTPVEQTDTPAGSTETEHTDAPAEQTTGEQTPTEPIRTQETGASTEPTRTQETDVPVEQAPAASAGAETPPPAGADRSSVGHSGETVSPSTGDSDLGAARASLTRTLATFSRRAAATEDPRRAREHLEAAREAAEALAALRR